MTVPHLQICILKQTAAFLVHHHLSDHLIEGLARFAKLINRFSGAGTNGNPFCCTLMIGHAARVSLVTIYFFASLPFNVVKQ
jgi:hypothetical protein